MRKTDTKQPCEKRGLLIVLEGIDGSGKSTQARLLVRRLAARGLHPALFREPTRGKWGRLIREKARRAGSLTPEQELDLFVRDRRENVERNLEPALAAGKTVVLDRYYFSTVAYQGAKGIDAGRIRRMNERFAVRPDLVFIIDIEAGRGLARIGGRGRRDELFEREDYLDRVREIFNGFKGRKFVHIDGNRDIRDISDEILGKVLKLLRFAIIDR
jgi:dTMP kinase